MRRLTAFLLVFVMLFALLCGCSAAPGRYDASYMGCFDTAVILSGYFKNKADADAEFGRIFTDIEYLHRLFDIYHTYSGMNNIKTVNDSPGQWVKVDAPLVELMAFSREVYGATAGRVDIALGSVLSLWHDARESEPPALPGAAALEAASAHTGPDAYAVDEAEGAVMLIDPLARLDVGAVAKGFAAEYAANNAMARGVSGVLINLGGNVRCIGEKPDGAWRVAVQDPDDESGSIATAMISGLSFVTSGDYQRYFMLDGVRYCHIIDPQTCYPAARYRSVSVICEDSAWADALSTALFLLNIEDGEALTGAHGAQALWVLPDGSLRMTDGMAAYISQ